MLIFHDAPLALLMLIDAAAFVVFFLQCLLSVIYNGMTNVQ